MEDIKNEHFEYWKKASTTNIQESGEMRNMWYYRDPAETSLKSQHNGQQKRKHTSIVCCMPREEALSRTMAESQENKDLLDVQDGVSIQKEQGEILRDQMRESLGMDETETIKRVVINTKNMADRIACLGNGQVPAVVRLAWETLTW